MGDVYVAVGAASDGVFDDLLDPDGSVGGRAAVVDESEFAGRPIAQLLVADGPCADAGVVEAFLGARAALVTSNPLLRLDVLFEPDQVRLIPRASKEVVEHPVGYARPVIALGAAEAVLRDLDIVVGHYESSYTIGDVDHVHVIASSLRRPGSDLIRLAGLVSTAHA